MMRQRWQKGYSEIGAAAVEFALILPILVLFVFGIVEFGRAFNAQVTITHAAREGARVWALGGTEAEARDAAQSAATTLTLHDPMSFTTCDPGKPTRVTATSDFEWLFMPPNLSFSDFTLTGIGEMRCGG